MNLKDQLNKLSEKHTESFQKGGMTQELAAAMKKQGISIIYGFDGKPQYWKNGKVLTGQAHGNAALLHSRTVHALKRGQTRSTIVSASQSLPAQFLDPTGVSGWSDFNKTVLDAWDTSSKLDKGLATVGAIPGLAMLKKPIMAIKGASKIAKAAQEVAPAVKKMISPPKKSSTLIPKKSSTLIPKGKPTKTVLPLYDKGEMPNPYSKTFLDLPYSEGVTTTGREVKKWMEEARPAWDAQYGTSRFIDKDLGLFAKRKFADRIEEIPNEIGEYNRVFTDPFLDQHGFNRNLSPDDKVLVESYAQGYDHLFNRRARIEDEGYNREFYENDIIPSFENLITKNKLKNDTSVARSMKDHLAKVERNGEEMRIRMSELQDGDIYIPESFLSTSLNRQNDFGDMMFDIDLPKGQSYLIPNATRRSPFPNEQELD